MSHQVVWFDLPATDVERAILFYSTVLNADISKVEGPEGPMGIFPHEKDDVAGCLYKKEGGAPSGDGPLLYFNVQGRLEEATSLVEKNGGKIVQPAHSIAPNGSRSVVMDSEGNRIALHSM